jgi:uncharacterized protein YfiM (DUF2279 family)
MVKNFILAGLIALTAAGCGKDEPKPEPPANNQKPTCSITSPMENAQFYTNESISVAVVAEDADGTVAEVKLYVDNAGYSSKTDFPYNFTINANFLTAGLHTIKAVAKDNRGASSDEASVTVTVITKPEFSIGDNYQGGIIAYVDATGKHGLIAAPSDQSTGVKWWLQSSCSVVTDSWIGSGENNTNRLVQAGGTGNYAARICYDLVLNGYSDWFLPSLDELEKLYINRDEVGGFSPNGFYWSSTEAGSYYAYYVAFSLGNIDDATLYNTYRVRAVRAF